MYITLMPMTHPSKFIASLLAFSLAAFAGRAISADYSPQVWINPGLYSYHFDRSKNFRDNNIGAGAEVLITVARQHDDRHHRGRQDGQADDGHSAVMLDHGPCGA